MLARRRGLQDEGLGILIGIKLRTGALVAVKGMLQASGGVSGLRRGGEAPDACQIWIVSEQGVSRSHPGEICRRG